MIKITLTKGKVAIIDEDNFELIKKHSWCACKKGKCFYAVTSINGALVGMHRLILGITDGRIDVDHINHNGCDNRKINLCLSTRSANLFQSRSMYHNKNVKKTSQFKGVSFMVGRENRWQVRVGGSHCGVYFTEYLAARAYDYSVIKLLGLSQALIGLTLNFPDLWRPRKFGGVEV